MLNKAISNEEKSIILACVNATKTPSNVNIDILKLTAKEVLPKINLAEISFDESEAETISPVYKAVIFKITFS